jgi:hypothetical protein
MSSDALVRDVLYGVGADCFSEDYSMGWFSIISIFVVVVLMPFDV